MVDDLSSLAQEIGKKVKNTISRFNVNLRSNPEKRRENVFKKFLSEGINNDEELKYFIKHFMGFVVPDTVHSKGHNSPFQMLSDMYFEKVLKGIGMANRTGSKTRTVSILNFLDAFFKGVEVGLVAATRDQADKGYKYLTEYLRVPEIRNSLVKSLKSETEFKNGAIVTIHTGTIKGLNSGHPCKLSVDEVELIEYPTLEEGFSMTKSQKGHETRDLFTSTRKKMAGTMNRLLEEADVTGTRLYKWNIWDVLERCERQCFGDKKHGDCKAWARCKGEAHEVPGGFYKISDFIGKASQLSNHVWKMQWLCEKSSEARLVYNDEFVDEKDSFCTWEEFLEATGYDSINSVDWSKFKHYAGIDFGHNFVYLHYVQNVGAKAESRGHRWQIYEYYWNKDRTLYNHSEVINKDPYTDHGKLFWKYYDTAGKQDALELGGYGVKGLCPAEKNVSSGIDVVRYQFKAKELTIIREACPVTCKELEQYSFPTDSAGNITSDKPEKGFDHCMDAKRYAVYGEHLKLMPAGYGSLTMRSTEWLR